jgi:hypothetical protein
VSYIKGESEMANFKQDILEIAGDEPIEAIVIGEMGWSNYNEKGKPNWKDIKGKLLPWHDAIPYLDYEYDTGFGAPDCQAINAWTASKVIFVIQYDGATMIESVPRNPIPHIPEMPGG